MPGCGTVEKKLFQPLPGTSAGLGRYIGVLGDLLPCAVVVVVAPLCPLQGQPSWEMAQTEDRGFAHPPQVCRDRSHVEAN